MESLVYNQGFIIRKPRKPNGMASLPIQWIGDAKKPMGGGVRMATSLRITIGLLGK